jgi:1,4-dihydroxy-2-naphthoyl-CoA hydrolase
MTNQGEAIAEYIAAMPQGMGSLNDKMGIEILELSIERLVATMPVEGNTQPYGLLHGGASVVLAESLGSMGSGLHAMTLGKVPVGVDINATHHRSATSGAPAPRTRS